MNRIAYVLPDDDNDDDRKVYKPSLFRRLYRSLVTILTMVLGIVTFCALCFMLYLALHKDKIPYFSTQITVAIAKATGKTPDEIEKIRRDAAKRTSIYLPQIPDPTSSQTLEPLPQADVELIKVGKMPNEVIAIKTIAKLSNAQINNAIKIVEAAEKYDVEPLLLLAIAYTDSRLIEDSSSVDGIGVIAISPEEAEEVAKHKGIKYEGEAMLKNIDGNLLLTAANLADLKKLFHGNIELMLYSKHLGRKKLLKILADNRELPDATSRYVQRVLLNYGDLQNRMQQIF